ncbi:MAG: [protein-PII] uridylyltransferase [Proteobacteria bacterium]|nr:[protein-PII] uridylyltransferase [Pseudomonadota bacterium]
MPDTLKKFHEPLEALAHTDLNNPKACIKAFKALLAEAQEYEQKQFISGIPASQLIRDKATFIDHLFKKIWTLSGLDPFDSLCLIAIGGYGRQELHPYSDIDLLILTQTEFSKEMQLGIEQFIRFAWDIDLEISHSVRTLSECLAVASQDSTVISNLLEMRLLTGTQPLFDTLENELESLHCWSPQKFFLEKCHEQTSRYKKYNQTAYNLEPNVKNGPGGLRDIHMIGWLGKKLLHANSLEDLVQKKFLTQEEYQLLIEKRDFLAQVRYVLHYHSRRREDRLLFDYQKTLAQQFGYHDKLHQLAIEQFMKEYYRNLNSVRALNEMSIQLFRENLQTGATKIQPINQYYQIHNQAIEVKHDTVFREHPIALLEIFLLMAEHSEIQGIRGNTMRLLHQNKDLIDDDFRHNPAHTALFLNLLRQSSNLTEQLRRMKSYGILGQYIPEFGAIIGQMQYDLFHVYTVDEHSLFLLRNLRRFTHPEYRGSFSLCADIMETVTKPEILYIVALFHDIAKGRRGDHSKLGARDVKKFCLRHGFEKKDIELAVWLVLNHLLMSSTAQRKDIFDPVTVKEFTDQIQDQTHLDYLYLHTVADVCATNPNLWNSWKDKLFRKLYNSTKDLLTQENKTINVKESIQSKKIQAYQLLKINAFTRAMIYEFWKTLPDNYFLRESPGNIAWHAQVVLDQKPTKNQSIVQIKQHHTQGATEIFIYGKLDDSHFARNTTLIANHHLNILESRVFMTKINYHLSTFIVLGTDNQPVYDEERMNLLSKSLIQNELKEIPRLGSRRIHHPLKQFHKITQIKFTQDLIHNHTLLEVISSDRPGLLATISQIFVKLHLRLPMAKITTLDERIQDIFYLTDQNDMALSEETQKQLAKELEKTLALTRN